MDAILPVEDIVRRFQEVNPRLRLANRAREAKFQRDYRKDTQHQLSNALSSAVYVSLRKGKKGRHWEVLVGYTVAILMKHVEKMFTEGMSWDNYGKWHIDHIIPRVAFHYTSTDDIDFKRCWSLSNLQPLWARDNEVKHSTITKPFQPSLAIKVTPSPPVTTL